MKIAHIVTTLVAGMLVTTPVFAQESLVHTAQTLVASTDPARLKATVTAVDRNMDALTLRVAPGRQITVPLAPATAGRRTPVVGDTVDVTYRGAVLLSANKVDEARSEIRENIDTTVFVPTASGYEAAQQIEMLATVQRIDKVTRHVTFRGARQTMTVPVASDFDLSELKEGSMVQAVCVDTYSVES